jgi:hypothetical protein
MTLLNMFLTPGRQVRVAANGAVLTGEVVSLREGWLRLHTERGEALINLEQTAWIDADGRPEEPPETGLLPVPSSKEIVSRPGSRSFGRPWQDDEVRGVVDGFLDGRGDAELADETKRTRQQITVLRQAWECARGNLPEDRISPAGTAWIERLRKILGNR